MMFCVTVQQVLGSVKMWYLILSVSLCVGAIQSENVVAKIAALLPSDDGFMFSLSKIRIALNIAKDKVVKFNYGGRNVTFDISYADSQCSDKHGMNQAITMYMNKKVHVFFGPTCDYSVAPLARQVTFWNLPLVSVGALSQDFQINKLVNYPFLTRAGPADLSSLANFFEEMFKRMGWKTPLIIYDKEATKDAIQEFCNFCTTALHYANKYKYYKLERELNAHRVLVEEVGNKYAGKSLFVRGGCRPWGAEVKYLMYVLEMYF